MRVSGVTGHDIARAVAVMRDGGVVAFPTETYYGLGVDPFNEEALTRLFEVKNRPTVKPILVVVPDRSRVDLLVSMIPDVAVQLMDAFWPGPLTLVLPARENISPLLSGGTGTVGVRLSPHPVVRILLDSFGHPMTATSANLSGEIPAVSAEEVSSSLGDRVDVILDGGITSGQKGSTLVGVNLDEVEYIREGCISFADIRNCLSAQRSEPGNAQT